MATLKIYPGCTGMQESLIQIERRIAGEMQITGPSARPRDGLSMLATEVEHQARGRRLADLWTAKDVLEAHLDLCFINESLASGREELRMQGARNIKSCGWCWTRVTLRGGLVLKLESPYLRRSSASRKKRSRGKAGVGIYPLLWGLGFELQMSPASRAEIARQTVLSSSYEEAREQLGRQGLELDTSSIVQVAVHVGRKGLGLRDRSVRAARHAPLAEHSSLADKYVRIGLDGGRARTRHTQRGRGIRPGKNGRRPFKLDWQEPRVLTIDVLDEHGEVDRRLRPIYETTLAKADGAMDLVVGTLRLLGVHLASKVVFVADGAEWIWRRIVQALLDEVGIELELMDYAELRAQHLSIGSGVVESAVRRIINLRFKSRFHGLERGSSRASRCI